MHHLSHEAHALGIRPRIGRTRRLIDAGEGMFGEENLTGFDGPGGEDAEAFSCEVGGDMFIVAEASLPAMTKNKL